MKKLNIKLIVALTLASVVAVPMVAKPVMNKITAYLNPSIQYVYDGQEVLKGSDTITYKDKNYVSVNDLSVALGKEVTFKDGKVYITTPSVTDGITIERATIKEINKDSKQVTVLPEGKEDQVENYKVLNVSDETQIQDEKNKKTYTFSDLEEGMTIKVVHAVFETASMPPQTPALTITVLGEAAEVPVMPEKITIEKATIKEVTDKQVTILPEGKEDRYENYVVLNVSSETLIRHEVLKPIFTIGDLKEGMTVKAVRSPIMTFSMPPQTPAFEIVILKENGDLTSKDDNDDNDDIADLTEIDDAQIMELNHSGQYMVVKNDNGTYTVKFTNKTKVEYEDSKKNPNVNSLKVGQVVDIELKDGVAVEIEVE